MPVKKLGSKLAQGVRQVQSQQVETPPPTAADTRAQDVYPKDRGTASPDEKPPVSPSEPGDKRSSVPRSEGHKRLHPRRVWPD